MWMRLAAKAMFYLTDCVVLTCTWCLDSLPTSQNSNQGWKNWPTLYGNFFVIECIELTYSLEVNVGGKVLSGIPCKCISIKTYFLQ